MRRDGRAKRVVSNGRHGRQEVARSSHTACNACGRSLYSFLMPRTYVTRNRYQILVWENWYQKLLYVCHEIWYQFFVVPDLGNI